MGIIIKQCLRTQKDTRSLCGAVFDTIMMATEGSRRVCTTRAYRQLERSTRWDRLRSGLGGGLIATFQKQGRQWERHEHGREVRSRQVLQDRSDVPVRASSHHAVGRLIRGARRSRERTAAAGCSTQVRHNSPNTIVAQTATVAGRPSRQVGRDEMVLRAVSAWLGERGITPRSPRWMTMVRSEAAQRMALPEEGNALFPSILVTPSFSVRQIASDAVTREQESLRISSMGDWLMTGKGVPPPSCLGTSASGSSVEAKPAGNVKVVGTSLRLAMMLDQQLNAAVRTGLRHSLDDSDHDATVELSENEACLH